jgi:hypothetical protein
VTSITLSGFLAYGIMDSIKIASLRDFDEVQQSDTHPDKLIGLPLHHVCRGKSWLGRGGF